MTVRVIPAGEVLNESGEVHGRSCSPEEAEEPAEFVSEILEWPRQKRCEPPFEAVRRIRHTPGGGTEGALIQRKVHCGHVGGTGGVDGEEARREQVGVESTTASFGGNAPSNLAQDYLLWPLKVSATDTSERTPVVGTIKPKQMLFERFGLLL